LKGHSETILLRVVVHQVGGSEKATVLRPRKREGSAPSTAKQKKPKSVTDQCLHTRKLTGGRTLDSLNVAGRRKGESFGGLIKPSRLDHQGEDGKMDQNYKREKSEAIIEKSDAKRFQSGKLGPGKHELLGLRRDCPREKPKGSRGKREAGGKLAGG